MSDTIICGLPRTLTISELASNAFARDRRVGDCRQAFTRDVVHDVEDAKAPAVGELVVDEVE
jgi:hypothetical protein